MVSLSTRQRRWKKAALVFLAGYIIAHFALSRISLVLVRRDWGIDDAFLYLPVKPDLVADHEMPLLYLHLALRGFFYPVWAFDHHFLGGPWAMRNMPMRSLSP